MLQRREEEQLPVCDEHRQLLGEGVAELIELFLRHRRMTTFVSNVERLQRKSVRYGEDDQFSWVEMLDWLVVVRQRLLAWLPVA